MKSKNYTPPSVRVVSFAIEHGFVASPVQHSMAPQAFTRSSQSTWGSTDDGSSSMFENRSTFGDYGW